jgi:hypothetical protein
MEQTKKTCKKCNIEKIKELDFTRSITKGKYQYGNCKLCHQEYTRAWRYGITVEAMNTLLDSNSSCEICNEVFDTKRKVIDHCHKDGHIRGILCDSCNTTLGQLERTPSMLEDMINYLKTRNKNEIK